MKKWYILACFTFFAATVSAQLREIPKPVRDQFQKQYPMAHDAEFRDNIVDVHVVFRHDSARMVAKYTNKGDWKETEKPLSFDLLPAAVKDGFDKSRYLEWKMTEAAIIYLPAGKEQYRIRVEKNELHKKYLFFNVNGRLLREALTI
ncbi:MAG TPA: PepSY-like domain-containing protein [Flavisolibacter sp.]